MMRNTDDDEAAKPSVNNEIPRNKSIIRTQSVLRDDTGGDKAP
jgi:hypothetical protein